MLVKKHESAIIVLRALFDEGDMLFFFLARSLSCLIFVFEGVFGCGAQKKISFFAKIIFFFAIFLSPSRPSTLLFR